MAWLGLSFCLLWLVPALAAGTAGTSAPGAVIPVFGLVHGADADAIILRTADGKYVAMAFSGSVSISTSRRGSLADVSAGRAIVAGANVDANGNSTTTQTIVYAGADPTHSPPWFGGRVVTVVTGVVSQVSIGPSTSNIQISYAGGEENIVVPTSGNVTVIAPATLAGLTRNANVRVLAEPQADGGLIARQVEILE